MRIPVGSRPTHVEAMDAARESAAMTGLRYDVYTVPGCGVQFAPAATDEGDWIGLRGETVDPSPHEPMRV